jgi:hypothetical protein
MLMPGLVAYSTYGFFQKSELLGLCWLAVMVAIWARDARNTRIARARLQALAASRGGESICGFARSFDCRAVDTWIVRAVYEELQEALQLGETKFPVRASDSLYQDLFAIDPDTVDAALAPDIAERTGRSMDRAEENPYRGKVATVRDLVMFFNAQPRLS